MNRQALFRRRHIDHEPLIRWLPVILMVLTSLALGLGEDELRLWGRFDREALAAGQFWRLITAHLVHLSWGHVWLNLAALVMMAALFSDVMPASDWVLASILSAVSIDVGLYFFEPDVSWYVGLSGALHGMMIVGAFGLVKHYGAIGYVLLIGVGGKLLWEQGIGPIPLSESTSGGPALVAAHFYGAIGGLLAQLTRIILRR